MTRNVPAALAWGRCRATRTLCVAGRLAAVAAGVTSPPMRDRPIADGFATHHQPGIEASPRPGPAGTCTTHGACGDRVGRSFSQVTDKAECRSVLAGAGLPVQRIDHFVAADDTNCQPLR